MSTLKPFLIFILVIGFFSCDKDNAVDTDTSGVRLKRMVSTSDSMWYASFEYDGQGRLIAIKDTNSQLHIGNTSIQYDQQNRMIKMVSKRYYQSMSNITGQWTDSFAYDNNNRIVKKIFYFFDISTPKTQKCL